MREEYRQKLLDEGAVDPDPLKQFGIWFEEAAAAGLREANAMALATATASGAPSVRMVLLKGFSPGGFVFYTNYSSRKGRELAENPRAAAVIYWRELERQVRIEGRVERVSRAESEAYFQTRPYLARIGALASRQSEPLASRRVLEERIEELVAKRLQDVPRPDDWGGYTLLPECYEFWQGRPNRCHDRLLYRGGAAGGWTITRLSP